MRDYLKEYGTFQQQKLAIAEEYAEKIRKAEAAGNKGEVLRLQKQQQAAIAGVDTAAIKAEIDWAEIFGEFGGMFQKEIDGTLQKLRDYMRSDEYKGLSATEQNEITDAVANLQQKASSDLSSVNFKTLGGLITEYDNAVNANIAAKNRATEMYAKLKKAQAAYDEAVRNGTKIEAENAKLVRDTVQQQAKVTCGSSGSFVDTNYFALEGGTFPTWYVAFATSYDTTGVDDIPTKKEVESSLSVLSDSIDAKVTQTDFDALGERVSTAESSITPDAIKLTVKEQTTSIANSAAANVARRTDIEVDATGLDQNKYYPVTIQMEPTIPYTITVERILSAVMGVPHYSTHSDGFSLMCKWQSNGLGWGTIAIKRVIFTYAYNDIFLTLFHRFRLCSCITNRIFRSEINIQ